MGKPRIIENSPLKPYVLSTFDPPVKQGFKAVISVYGHTFILYGNNSDNLGIWFDSIMEVLREYGVKI